MAFGIQVQRPVGTEGVWVNDEFREVEQPYFDGRNDFLVSHS